MTEPEFVQWKEEAIADYAADKVRAGNDNADGAVERSRKEFDSLLPEGLKTKGCNIFSVFDQETEHKVGMVWYADAPGPRKDMLWVYDIRIDNNLRGKGYGTAVLGLLEGKARELGKKRMGLHVFGHNQGARRLYERLGYTVTNISMAKSL